jgi:large conductance mechanosensitive channel
MVRNFLAEFKAFALKGNMIDLAVAVVLGTAFGAVIKSLVDNVMMPIISYVTPNMDFHEWHIGRIKIGYFLNDVLGFLFIALAVFIAVVKVMGWLMRMREKPAEAAPIPLSKQEELLTEIRDLLRGRA